MPFIIVRQDITRMKTDAVVNAANTDLAMGGGVCGAIFRAAGARELQAACDALAPIATGEAAVTPGFLLPARVIIHAAGPIYEHGNAAESERLLRCAYTNSLRLAVENGCESIAFPLISSGIYGYPKRDALRVATSAILDFLAGHDLDVYLAMLDTAALAVDEQLLGDAASYLDEHYTPKRHAHRYEPPAAPQEAYTADRAEAATAQDAHKKIGFSQYEAPMPAASHAPMEAPTHALPRAAKTGAGVEDWIGSLDEPFGKTLLRLIDTKGKTDVEVYKRANLDRKLFSKIRTGEGYTPSKRTAIALAVALELSLDETDDLLERAGYALSHSRKFDVIVEYFIVNGRYNVFEINEVLFKYDQPLLGS